MRPLSAESNDLRLIVYVACGFVAGGAFVAFDIYSESRIGAGTISGPHASAHLVIDHLIPLLVGPLLGMAAHYLRLRSQLVRAEERAQRADALELRLQKIERDQAVWVLSAAVLHELNNPLHALGLVLEELEAGPVDTAERERLLRRASAQTDRALAQLKRLRSMAGGAEPEIERVDLTALLQSVAEDVASLPRAATLTVTCDGDGVIAARADRTYLRTILENLADNSLHALESTTVGHLAFRVAADGDRAIVRVTDDGPPLPVSATDALFEPLSSTKATGLGLGLPVARALARAMHGDLILENAERKCFRLELPLADGTRREAGRERLAS